MTCLKTLFMTIRQEILINHDMKWKLKFDIVLA